MVDNWSGTQAQLNCNLTLAQAIRIEGIPTLADINVVFGNATSVRIITEHLQSILRYAGIDIAPQQLAETALSILASYYFLNLAELCIFFTQLKNGSRGQFVWGNRINNQSIMVAMIEGVKNIQELKEKAKNDFSAFTELFPNVPNNHTAYTYWKAYGGNEDAIRAIYGDNAPPPNIASDDIGRFLCDYNIRINRK